MTTAQLPIQIDELSISTGNGNYVVRDHGGVTVGDSGGEDYGSLAVRIAVDHQLDVVTLDLGTTGDVAGIERAIEALRTIHAQLLSLYSGRAGE